MWALVARFLLVPLPKYSGDIFVRHQPGRKGRENGRRNAKGIIRLWEASCRRDNSPESSSGNS